MPLNLDSAALNRIPINAETLKSEPNIASSLIAPHRRQSRAVAYCQGACPQLRGLGSAQDA